MAAIDLDGHEPNEPLSPQDQQALKVMCDAFEELVRLGRAAKTYGDIQEMDKRMDELTPEEFR